MLGLIAFVVSHFFQQIPAVELRDLIAATKPIICIDPGHPSEVSSGVELQNGATEVHLAWLVGLKLQEALNAKACTVILTKSKEDELVKNTVC